jgi:hypothetical protein
MVRSVFSTLQNDDNLHSPSLYRALMIALSSCGEWATARYFVFSLSCLYSIPRLTLVQGLGS